VLRALSLCACCRHYPGAAAGRRPRSSHPAVPAFPDNVVGSACISTFSGLAQRSLALRPAHLRRHLYVTYYTEGFSHFVTSMTAPVASGWSGCRVGLAPTEKRRLGTAHTQSGPCGQARCVLSETAHSQPRPYARAASSVCALAITDISGVGEKPSSAGARTACASTRRSVD
jgi:hypothetical protein